jgi:hypothetical protein
MPYKVHLHPNFPYAFRRRAGIIISATPIIMNQVPTEILTDEWIVTEECAEDFSEKRKTRKKRVSHPTSGGADQIKEPSANAEDKYSQEET